MNIIQNKNFDEERALYGSKKLLVKGAPLTASKTLKVL